MLSGLIPSREVWSAAEDEPEKDDGPVYFSYFASAAYANFMRVEQ